VFARVGITGAYTPTGDLRSEERGHLDITYSYLGWRAGLSWNRSDFYDLFGPTKRGRKGYAAKVGYDHLLIYDEPRKMELKFDLAYYDKIDRLPEAQNVGATFERLTTGEVGLYYTDARRSLGAVDDEKGRAWSTVLTVNRVTDETPALLRGSFDFGWPLPLPHSSIWLRSAAGVANGKRDNPVANFYFGGFGNNYVDNGTIKRYREYYSLPGFGLNEISGQSFARSMVEWNLPPVVFESVGTPGFHLTWLRPAVFASALWTDPERASRRREYASLGGQVDLRFSVLHWYDVTLSAGYAGGFHGARRAGTEWMLSLKIM